MYDQYMEDICVFYEILIFGIIYFSLVSVIFFYLSPSILLNTSIRIMLKIFRQEYST